MASLTKTHIKECFNQALDQLNKSGDRTPWPNEEVTILSPEEKVDIDFDWESSPLPDDFIADWFVVLQTCLYGIECGTVIALQESFLLDHLSDPYRIIVEYELDPVIKESLYKIKEMAEEKKRQDDEDLYGGVL